MKLTTNLKPVSNYVKYLLPHQKKAITAHAKAIGFQDLDQDQRTRFTTNAQFDLATTYFSPEELTEYIKQFMYYTVVFWSIKELIDDDTLPWVDRFTSPLFFTTCLKNDYLSFLAYEVLGMRVHSHIITMVK